ncbi:staphylopine uptake ABC transporter ATP-binding protein CntD [Halalkalibacter hemicellulosilyticus]|uniref:Oligopeptide transport ATP-binding protein OppD n=1 Tax=Halalkalibacter hemicellulosilyticusJCM 9152 TaxID=1236971 RepID=W4Q9K2_9BACI|nr:ABC transporter ATP-binding protein [Halalkalibacter hemicellulosilyticus]GAE28736.1 oligopeptide transport ATP-binding protein OppD [Halalkalibacter hemicellulosilyticusJCM 9152]
MGNLLDVSNLKVWDAHTGKVIVHNSSFHLKEGKCLAIVGESGSGKSVTCRAIMKLNKASLFHSGQIKYKGRQLNDLAERDMRKIRGKSICMILQNGMSAFDPTCTIGVHIKETLTEHFNMSNDEMIGKMQKAMESVRLKHPIEILNKYPHQLSGGMLQRIMIALAIVLEPDIIIADEPTTALDTISQFEVVEQLIQLRKRMRTSMIFVSHDLGIVRKIADDVLVMKDGRVIEKGKTEAIFSEPQHDYTKHLIGTRLALSKHFEQIMGGEAKVAES